MQIGENQWAVARLEEVLPREEPTLDDVRVSVSQRVKTAKEEELFLEKVADWREDYVVETHPEHLMKATYAPVEPQTESIPVTIGEV